jgi:dephospho-CoA kinase
VSHTKFYGLTGGIGSGKSTVSHMFADLNVPTLDLDKVGHKLLHEQSIQNQLQTTFGKSIVTQQAIDRAKLAAIAFQSKANTQALNQIMHPAIQAYEATWRAQQSAPFAIIEASVLIESGGLNRMHALIVVMCDKDIRLQRLLKRGKQSQAQINHIMQRQCSDEERLQYADYTLDNNYDLQQLEQQVKKLYLQL